MMGANMTERAERTYHIIVEVVERTLTLRYQVI